MKQHTTPSFRSYELPGVLYGDQRLILNPADRILTLVGGHGQLDAQACFSAAALAVTQALVDAHPAPCALDALYAAFAGVERAAAREILAALEQAEVLDLALRGLDAALADTRAQLATSTWACSPCWRRVGIASSDCPCRSESETAGILKNLKRGR